MQKNTYNNNNNKHMKQKQRICYKLNITVNKLLVITVMTVNMWAVMSNDKTAVKNFTSSSDY